MDPPVTLRDYKGLYVHATLRTGELQLVIVILLTSATFTGGDFEKQDNPTFLGETHTAPCLIKVGLAYATISGFEAFIRSLVKIVS